MLVALVGRVRGRSVRGAEHGSRGGHVRDRSVRGAGCGGRVRDRCSWCWSWWPRSGSVLVVLVVVVVVVAFVVVVWLTVVVLVALVVFVVVVFVVGVSSLVSSETPLQK